MSHGTETDLIRRAQAGDAGAFRELMRAHRQRVMGLIHRMLGPSNEAEDVAQDVYLHIHRSLGGFRGDARFSTWLYRLTANVVRMHIRRAQARPRLALVGSQHEQVFERQEAHTPADGAEQTERVAALYRALDHLSDKKRAVLVLHDLEGLPAREVAEIVEAPVLTVRTRLFYARKEVYALLADEDCFAGTEVSPRATPVPPAHGREEGGTS